MLRGKSYERMIEKKYKATRAKVGQWVKRRKNSMCDLLFTWKENSFGQVVRYNKAFDQEAESLKGYEFRRIKLFCQCMSTESNEEDSISIPYNRLWTTREFDIITEEELVKLIKEHENCEK